MRGLRFGLLLGLSLGIAGTTWAQVPGSRQGGPGGLTRFAQYPQAKPALGETAPPFALKDLDGKQVRLGDFAGKLPVVIEFGSFT